MTSSRRGCVETWAPDIDESENQYTILGEQFSNLYRNIKVHAN